MNDLLATIGISSEDERIVCGIHEDSRRVGKDWIFISRLGLKGEGKAYVCEAMLSIRKWLRGGVWSQPNTTPRPFFFSARMCRKP